MSGKSDSREKMIEAASRLFQLKGYNATGLNEILKESGSPKGSLYYYFPGGKAELALAAIELASQTIQDKIREGLSKYSDPASAILNVINNMVAALDQEGKLQNISISLISLETYLSNELLREACKKSFTEMDHIYAEKLSRGGFAEKIAHELGMVIQIMIEGAITSAVTRKDTAPLLAVAKQISVLISHYA